MALARLVSTKGILVKLPGEWQLAQLGPMYWEIRKLYPEGPQIFEGGIVVHLLTDCGVGCGPLLEPLCLVEV